ncbi:unnamed protein product [Hanseniaspora opuntiae]
MPYVAVLGFYLLFQIGAVIVMCVIYIPWFLIAIPFIILALFFIYSLYQSTGREVKRLEAVQRSLVYNNFNEVLSGSSTITTYKVEKLFVKKSNILIDKNNESAILYSMFAKMVFHLDCQPMCCVCHHNGLPVYM